MATLKVGSGIQMSWPVENSEALFRTCHSAIAHVRFASLVSLRCAMPVEIVTFET